MWGYAEGLNDGRKRISTRAFRISWRVVSETADRHQRCTDCHRVNLNFMNNISGGSENSYIHMCTAKPRDVLKADDVVEQSVLRHAVQHYNIKA
jgi:hypothetical protein